MYGSPIGGLYSNGLGTVSRILTLNDKIPIPHGYHQGIPLGRVHAGTQSPNSLLSKLSETDFSAVTSQDTAPNRHIGISTKTLAPNPSQLGTMAGADGTSEFVEMQAYENVFPFGIKIRFDTGPSAPAKLYAAAAPWSTDHPGAT